LPLAAGIAALILSLNKDLSWEDVRRYIRNTADNINQENGNYVNRYSLEYGYGRVNAYKALEAVYNTATTPTFQQLEGTGIRSDWLLRVIDRWLEDTGTLNSWGLKIRTKGNVFRESVAPGLHIPEEDPQGITSTLNFPVQGEVKDIKVRLDVSHTYIGDLLVSLTSPSNTQVILHTFTGGSADNINAEYTVASIPQLSQFLDENVSGLWKLHVADHAGLDVGKLNKWEIEIKI